jgi:hypothetical protein
MTKSTDKRQLRLLVEGVLRMYGVDKPEIEFKLSDAVYEFVKDDSGLPVKTREAILERLRKSMNKGQARHEQIEAMATEIEVRAFLRPVSIEWQDFLEWVLDIETPKGNTITKFLDWWVSDQWQLAHPPASPLPWRVKWPQAFANKTAPKTDTGAGFYV